MKKLLALLVMSVVSGVCLAQIKTFGQDELKLTLFRGDTVVVLADTASLLSSGAVHQISQLTDKYEALLERYNSNIKVNKRLLAQLTITKGSLEEVLAKSEEGGTQLTALSGIVTRLGGLSEELGDTNRNLEANTADLDEMIRQLREQNKELKKQIDRMWGEKAKDRLFGAVIGAAILGTLWIVFG